MYDNSPIMYCNAKLFSWLVNNKTKVLKISAFIRYNRSSGKTCLVWESISIIKTVTLRTKMLGTFVGIRGKWKVSNTIYKCFTLYLFAYFFNIFQPL